MSKSVEESSHQTRFTAPGDRELRIERVFDASRERVWRAFSDPEQLAQWWGRGNKLDIERFEFVRGGHWRFVEHAAGVAHGFEGRFGEIAPPERLEQTFEWDGTPGHVVMTVMTFDDLGDGRTRVVSVNLFHTTEDRDRMLSGGMEAGLNQSYAVLDALLTRTRH